MVIGDVVWSPPIHLSVKSLMEKYQALVELASRFSIREVIETLPSDTIFEKGDGSAI